MIYYSHPNQDTDRQHEGFSSVDIPLPGKMMNVAEITLTEKYPREGFACNTESEMVVRILKGDVVFQCEDEEVELSEGSNVLVPVGKKYCWIPRGSVTLYVVSSPPWTLEQHQSVPK